MNGTYGPRGFGGAGFGGQGGGAGGRGFGGRPGPGAGIWEAMEQLRASFEQRGGSPRMARGDVRAAVLGLLAEQPMHGYQIIQEIEERSGGSLEAQRRIRLPDPAALGRRGADRRRTSRADARPTRSPRPGGRSPMRRPRSPRPGRRRTAPEARRWASRSPARCAPEGRHGPGGGRGAGRSHRYPEQVQQAVRCSTRHAAGSTRSSPTDGGGGIPSRAAGDGADDRAGAPRSGRTSPSPGRSDPTRPEVPRGTRPAAARTAPTASRTDPAAGEAPDPALRSRYRRILTFAGRVLLQTWWFELVLPRIGLAGVAAHRGRERRMRGWPSGSTCSRSSSAA